MNVPQDIPMSAPFAIVSFEKNGRKRPHPIIVEECETEDEALYKYDQCVTADEEGISGESGQGYTLIYKDAQGRLTSY